MKPMALQDKSKAAISRLVSVGSPPRPMFLQLADPAKCHDCSVAIGTVSRYCWEDMSISVFKGYIRKHERSCLDRCSVKPLVALRRGRAINAVKSPSPAFCRSVSERGTFVIHLFPHNWTAAIIPITCCCRYAKPSVPIVATRAMTRNHFTRPLRAACLGRTPQMG